MGEPWGFMGSKRLLWEMYNDADTTTGLNLDVIEQVCPTVGWRVATPLDVDTCNTFPVSCYLHFLQDLPAIHCACIINSALWNLRHPHGYTCKIIPALLHLHYSACVTWYCSTRRSVSIVYAQQGCHHWHADPNFGHTCHQADAICRYPGLMHFVIIQG